MDLLFTLIGVTLILAVLTDVFRTLFASAEKGTAGQVLARAFWRGLRRIAAVHRPTILHLAGPIAFLATAGGWFVLSATGWALVYLPHMPSGFSFNMGLDASRGGFLDALYFSSGTIATLGYGDIVPTSNWLLMAAPLEALSGLGLLLGVFSWYLSNMQAISQRRSLANKIRLLSEAETEAGVAVARMDPKAAARILDDLAVRLVAVRIDLLRFPNTYYYAVRDERSSLPAVLPYLAWLAEEGGREDCLPEVRLYAATLRGAVDDFSVMVASRFLSISPSPTHRVLEEYSRDHLCERRPGGGAGFP
ncbi:hypothetical protein BH24ACT19_BH24ACT19_20480 [soil metagenome]